MGAGSCLCADGVLLWPFVFLNDLSKPGSGCGSGTDIGLQNRTLASAWVPGSLGAQARGADTERGGSVGPHAGGRGEFHTIGPGLSSLDLGAGGGCVLLITPLETDVSAQGGHMQALEAVVARVSCRACWEMAPRLHLAGLR